MTGRRQGNPGAPAEPGIRGALAPLLIAAAGVAAYANSLSGPFVLDDAPSITANPTIRSLGAAFFPPPGTTGAGRPILNLSLALNYAAGGTEVRGYHAVNLAIHVLAGLLLYGIVRRTLAAREDPAAALAAFCAALLWTVHPLQTEAVSYIIQRAESLMGLFYLLALYGFIRGTVSAARRIPWFAVSVGACLLGMGTKEVMVSAPLIILLYDRTFVAGSFANAWRARGRVHAGLFATALVLPLLVLSSHGRGGTAGMGTAVPAAAYALTQFPAIVHYLRLCVWPSPLVFDYGTALAAPSARVLGCALAVAGLGAATLWALVRRPAIGFLGAAFFAVLAPSSSIVPVATQTLAEHRMYLPLAAVAVLAVLAACRGPRGGTLAAVLVAAAALGVATWQRNETYRSAEGLWRDTVRERPGNVRAHVNLADALFARGRTDEAIAEYEAALRIDPQDADAHNNLGNALGSEGRTAQANLQYAEAVRLNPAKEEAHNNLGNALYAQGRTADAVAEYDEALRLNPDYAEAHNNLGNVLGSQGRTDEAIAQFEAVLRIRPELAEAHSNLGNALGAAHRTGEAVAQFEEALRLNPGYAAAHNNLGNALNEEHRPGEALVHYEEAVRLAPDRALFRLNLAVALLRSPGHAAEAVPQLEAVLRLEPDNAVARKILDEMGPSGR
jgi:tetratricopeptide (TPR) repeat protein